MLAEAGVPRDAITSECLDPIDGGAVARAGRERAAALGCGPIASGRRSDDLVRDARGLTVRGAG